MQQMWLKASVAGFVMILNSVEDIRKREIFPVMTAAFAVLGIVLRAVRIYSEGGSLPAFFPALVMLAAAMASESAAGFGDVLVLAFMGIWFDDAAALLSFAFALAGVTAFSFILYLRKKNRCMLPFIPFLAAGVLAAEITQKVIL